MRLLSLVVLAVLACAAKPVDTSDLTAKIRVVPVATDQHLYEPCSFSGRLHACTVFQVDHLDHQCRMHDDHWQLDIRMEIRAVIYLPQTRWLRHEWDHIDDVMAAVRELQRHVEDRHYESADACARSAAAEIAGLPRQMSIFVQASNGRLH